MADQPIIIKRIKKGGHAHHGGAWKLAYADFVTAMMAFFLLLWLLNSVTEEQLVGISNYFAPTAVSQSPSGAGGVLGGQVLGEGASQSNSSSPAVQLTLPPPTIGAGGQDFSDANEGVDASDSDDDAGKGEGKGASAGDLEGLGKLGVEPTDKQLAAAEEKRQQEEFNKTATELRQAIQAVPSLQALSNSLLIDNTPEGLRIQLIDREGLSMFPTGSSALLPHTRDLLALVAKAVADVPNKISISGHTDAPPYSDPSGYGNWELSADRALASRRVLLANGLKEDRVDRVVGKAETEPLLADDPKAPSNRRIAITLLRDRSLYAEGAAGGGNGGAAPADPLSGPKPPSILAPADGGPGAAPR
ncbi:OmpA/MotB [Rhodospirillum rubrum ATCC 11170]|uniref:OmpA/MotB n=2 Tax=Rhodospirillum rubrum TaxID=1085 RepID=Q2RTA2_RHORT|nr:flagellar motor protein MotB [Rhodospirillum rubrum]ABC22643.1 OmpA/MotB [Rhodospirillum rubrum ATCC 11170]